MLSSLELRNCGELSGSAFEGVGCKLLQGLTLEFCGGLTNAGLEAAAAACPSLLQLNVRNVKNGPDLSAGIESFTAHGGLETITVEGCRITDVTLRSFAVRCPLLKKVLIMHEDVITDAGVAAFMTSLPGLTRVDLVFNSQLSSEGLLRRSTSGDHRLELQPLTSDSPIRMSVMFIDGGLP
ncbi:Leucine rich repeat/RNI-like superfamily protein [Klebsormidium nitens]|uniref:Leucine rich repeat/RNI-like superfamily protein n=1 Tax=Klebsormidium nitens TaxID=105231 RepID=A0A1Y1I5K0_KLENI|nr:Leucine rich repeat/RNI-like superfamily protein [Klebsormidium nitens]|eukprot:GAQ86234.1 Leucine rich repeat/RNI-like superfamily protein [Klebsormidium nitens]